MGPIPYQVGCYGKLPIHGDFIRHQAGGPEHSWLDRWLQEGLVSLQETLFDAWVPSFEAATPMRFAIQVEKSTLVGVSKPSVDSAGRRFPFLVFTVLNARPIRKRPAGIPLALDEFLGRAEQLIQSDFSSVGLPGLLQSVSALDSAMDWKLVEQNLDSFLEQHGIGALWHALFGAAVNDRHYLLASNLGDLLGAKSNPRFPLELPYTGSPYHLSLWIEFCALTRGRDACPQAWSWRNANFGRAPLLRGAVPSPGPTHYLPLFLADHPCEDVCKLAEEGLSDPGLLSAARERHGALVDELQLPLGRFLERLAKDHR